ncbi:MAG: PfkB family carbohydrate kinase, partial [Kiritimatiellaeota bacterium]|nr:PfkB family carbohydrate kinase [Kiritimatiellota bacterium]
MPPPKTRFATITLAPAIDSVAIVEDRLTPSAVHHLRETAPVAGGKGINVAKLLARHGCAVAAGGFLGEDDADLFAATLAKAGIDDRFARVPGETRRNLMLIDARGEYKLNRPAFPDMAYRRPAIACA